MFQWIAFLIALIAGTYKLLKGEKITVVYFIVSLIIGAIASMLIAFVGGFMFPAEAVALTRAGITTFLLEHFFSAFVGSIIAPIVAYISTIKIE